METEDYQTAETTIWPQNGNHILADFDDKTIVCYQAYNAEIANYAVQHQKFGGPFFSPTRMTWFKTNFFWMMYRCGYGRKDKNQTHILRIRLKREFFESILENSVSTKIQLGHESQTQPASSQNRSKNRDKQQKLIRLQWDPDHLPNFSKHPGRRAIQLGLRGYFEEINQNIVSIQDITQFCSDLYEHNMENLNNFESTFDGQIPMERIYSVSKELAEKIGADVA